MRNLTSWGAALVLAIAPMTLAAPGDLDATFGIGGVVVGPSGGARAVAVQPDGSIVVAGTTSSSEFLVSRYLPNGAPDTSFGTLGTVTTSFGPGGAVAEDVVLQQIGADLTIVVVGGADGDFALARYLPDGTLDSTFDGDGIRVVDFGGYETAQAVVVQPDGKIVVTGGIDSSLWYYGAYPSPVVTARFDLDGALDSTFDTDGWVETTPGISSSAFDVALVQDGADLKVAVGGTTWPTTSTLRGFYARYLPSGALDGAFGTAGIVLDGSATDTWVEGMAGLADGSLVGVGYTYYYGPGAYESLMQRRESDGSLDWEWITNLGGAPVQEFLNDVAVQPDGKVVASGYLFDPDSRFVVVRRLADGTLDPGFGTGGVVVTPIGSGGAFAQALALQADGKILVAGASSGGVTLARYEGEPTSVCGNGVVEAGEGCDDGNTAAGDCCSPACAVDADGAPCADGDACTTGETCSAGVCAGGGAITCPLCQRCEAASGCVPGPRTACKLPLIAAKASLQLRDATPDANDQVKFNWTKGEATTFAEFGDPVATDAYALCIFDASSALLLRMVAPAGGTCGAQPCWKQLGATVPKGYKYKDDDGLPHDLDKIKLKAGAAGAAKASVQGKGDNVPMPALGSLALALPLRAQLQSGNGGCYEATFTTPLVNTTERFKAKAD